MTYWDEIQRKAIHLGSSLFSLIYVLTDKPFMLKLMIPLVVFAVVVESLRQFVPPVQAFVQRWLGSILRVEEKRLFTGATYVAIGVLISVMLFPKPIAITVMLFLSVSDAFASLIGIKFGKTRFLGKSAAGSLAFLLTALIIVICVMPSDHRWIGVAGAFAATITEAISFRWREFKLDDNFSIPLVSGGVMLGLTQLIG